MRRPLIAGNWKMNPPTQAEAYGLARAVAGELDPLPNVDAVVCPPASLPSASGPSTDGGVPPVRTRTARLRVRAPRRSTASTRTWWRPAGRAIPRISI